MSGRRAAGSPSGADAGAHECAAGDAAVPDRAAGQPAAPERELQLLRAELTRLERELRNLKTRLDLWEQAGAAEPSAARPADLAAPAPPLSPLSASPSITEPAAPVAAAEVEQELAGSLGNAVRALLNLAAVVALVLAVGYVARLGLAKGSITSLLAIAAGCGGLLLLAGAYRRSGSLRLALWLEGGAVGVGYLSAYAAFAASGSLVAALLLAALITAGAGALALARDSEAVATFALAGAGLTPLMMRGGLALGEHTAALLFAYLALLNISTLILSRLRWWPWQASWSLVATHFMAWLWYAEHRHADPLLTLVFPIATFAAFLARPLVLPARARGPAGGISGAAASDWREKTVLVANTLLFLAALQTLLFAYAPRLLPLAPAGLGLLHGAAAWLMPAALGLAATHMVMMLVLVLPGVWLAAPGLAPLAWIGTAALLGVIGLRYQRWSARLATPLLLAAAALFAPRVFIVVPAAFVGVWYLRRAAARSAEPDEVEWLSRWALASALLLAGQMAAINELGRLLAWPPLASLAPGSQFFYSLSIAVYGAALAIWGRRQASLFFRTSALLLFAALAAKVFLLDLATLGGGWRIGSLMLLAVSLLALTGSRKESPPRDGGA